MESFYFFLSKLSYRRWEGALISNLMGCLERFGLGSDGTISVLIIFMHLAGSYLLQVSFPPPLKLLGRCTSFSHVSWEAKVLNVPNIIKSNWKGSKKLHFCPSRGEHSRISSLPGDTWENTPVRRSCQTSHRQRASLGAYIILDAKVNLPWAAAG